MAVGDWGDDNRWWIVKGKSLKRHWLVYPPNQPVRGKYLSFAEAHAAYLDAVTCDAQTPFPNYTEPRCTRSRGHQGGHWFTGKNGMTDLEQMPR